MSNQGVVGDGGQPTIVGSGGVPDLGLVSSVASLWSQDDPGQLFTSIPAINGSVATFGGSVGPQLFGNTSGLGRLSNQQQQRSIPQQRGVAGVLPGATTGGIGSSVSVGGGGGNSGGFIGTKVSSSWSSGLGQASAWSTGAQGGLSGPATPQVASQGGPVGAAVQWGRGRGANMTGPSMGSMRGGTSGQPCPTIGVGKVSPSLAANIKFRRSTSFPGKTGIPQHGGFPPGQMQPAHLQGHLPPSFEITSTDDTRDYLQFQV